jgi:hypothetical protein
LNPIDLKPFYLLAQEPTTNEDFDRWIRQDEVMSFLEDDMNDDHILLYVSLPHFFLHAVLVPKVDVIQESTWEELEHWNLSVDSTWGIASCADELSLCEPLEHTGSTIIDQGEKLLFLRDFDGIDRGKCYLEMNQRLCHVLGLHHLPERKAWCRLDDDGDIEEVIKIYNLPEPLDGRVVSMSKRQLAIYAGVTDQMLARMIDITRYRSGGFGGWNHDIPRVCLANGTLRGQRCVQPGTGSYFRGVQLADIGESKATILKSTFSFHDDEDKQYETFIALDWRNKQIGELSCDPKKLANYFVPMEGPFQTTPAFFKPEVLSKYKADPDKYTIDDHSISCRGTWYLQSWDVNDAGQVFTYLCYLGNLPHKEQLHWKQFNETPKAGLPDGTIKTDFLGVWDDSYDPLRSLVSRCRKLSSDRRSWWKVRDETLFTRTHYPHSDGRAEWANELMNLDQLLIESLEERKIRAIAKAKKATTDDRMRALKLIEASLVADGFETDHAREIMGPFHAVHNLRSELKGHASDGTAKAREVEARKVSDGSLVNHFKSLCQGCDESLELIAKCLGE